MQFNRLIKAQSHLFSLRHHTLVMSCRVVPVCMFNKRAKLRNAEKCVFVLLHKASKCWKELSFEWLKSSSRDTKLNLLFESNLLNQFGCINIDLGTLSVHMFCASAEECLDVIDKFRNGHSGKVTSISFFIINLSWGSHSVFRRCSPKMWYFDPFTNEH